jgi:hypothetical protein
MQSYFDTALEKLDGLSLVECMCTILLRINPEIPAYTV